MITLELHPNSYIHESLELRSTQLESEVNNTYRPSVPELQRQETMAIGDVMHSYILHYKLGFDYLDWHQKKLKGITDRDIDLSEYRNLSDELPSFHLIEHGHKIRIMTEFHEIFFTGTIDGINFDLGIYDLKFSGKKRPPSRVNKGKQKIYYTFLNAITSGDWSMKDFSYCIFTTNEKKPRLFVERFTLDPKECEAIFMNDLNEYVKKKEYGLGFQYGGTSGFV